MILHRPQADVFFPLGGDLEHAHVTHLGVGAHQDDLEFMAVHGILECYEKADRGFAGIICADGAGSSRQGPYSGISDSQMREIRREEQRAAARVGKYHAMVQLDYPSAEVRSNSPYLQEDLAGLFRILKPQVVYTHNPLDKHETHLSMLVATLEALRSLPPTNQPSTVYGCEVWRGLDWLCDEDKVALDISARPELRAALNAVFDSQISGGKRYDLATQGRAQANATFHHAYSADAASHIAWAVDLTPLLREPTRDLVDFAMGFVERFRKDVHAKLTRALDRH